MYIEEVIKEGPFKAKKEKSPRFIIDMVHRPALYTNYMLPSA
jgi:hypothetical protein